MMDYNNPSSALEEGESDDISCQTGATTLRASNVFWRKFSLQGQRLVEHRDAWLRGNIAELLWLASAEGDPTVAVLRRRFILRFIGSYTNSNDATPQYDIGAIIQFFGIANQLRGNLASNLFNMLNATEPGTNVFAHRPSLGKLIRDILELPPEKKASADEGSLSGLTGQIDGVTALQENDLDVLHGNHVEEDFADDLKIQGSPLALPQSPILNTGGCPLSETVAPEDPKPEDLIVARFLAGDFHTLRAKYEPDVLIFSLSSSIAVMRSLVSLDNTHGETVASTRIV